MRPSVSMLTIAAALSLAVGCSSTVTGHASFAGPRPTPTHRPVPTSPSPTTVDGGTATVATYEYAQNFNPYSVNGDYGATSDIVWSVLPYLYTLTASNNYLPNRDLLAGEPTVSKSKGHQVVTYSLSPDAKWSDGTPIGVDDFKFLVQEAKQQKDKFAVPGYTAISSVTKGSDDHHVVVTFAKPNGDWRSFFNPLLPAHYLRKAGWESGFRGRIPVSAGPFRLSSVTATQATLVKDRNYFGKKAHLDKIIFRAMPNPAAAAAATAAGALDASYADPVTGTVPSSATAVDGGYFTQLTFNVRTKPLNNLKVRQAIAYALDRQRIAQVGSPAPSTPSKVAANNLFAAGSHGGTKNDAAYRTQNLARAKQLMRSAGYGRGKTLTLRMLTTDYDNRRVAAGQLIMTELRDIGIRVVLTKQPADALFNTLLPRGQFDLALYGWTYQSTAGGAADLLGCHGTQNFGKYCNANFDRLVAQSLAEPGLAKHNELLNKADHQLWKDLPQIPLYQSKALVAVSPKMHGVTYDPGEFTIYWDTADWTKAP